MAESVNPTAASSDDLNEKDVFISESVCPRNLTAAYPDYWLNEKVVSMGGLIMAESVNPTATSSDDRLNEQEEDNDYLSTTDDDDDSDYYFPAVTGDKRKMHELTNEQLLKLFPTRYISKKKTIETVLPTLRKYLEELEESEGFDIDHFPGFIMGLTPIYPSHLAHGFIESDDTYLDLAEFALAEFNEEHGTMYGYAEVEKVNLSVSNYNYYYITFTAELVDGYDDDDDDDETDGGSSKEEETDVGGGNKGKEEIDGGSSKEEETDVGGGNKGKEETDGGASKGKEETDGGGSKEETDGGGSKEETDGGSSKEEETDGGGSKEEETDVGGRNKGTDGGGSKEEETDGGVSKEESDGGSSKETDGGSSKETDGGSSKEETDGGSSKEEETDGGGSKEATDVGGRNEETDAGSGGSNEIGVRKKFQARVARNMIGKHMPEIKFCRLKTMPKPNC